VPPHSACGPWRSALNSVYCVKWTEPVFRCCTLCFLKLVRNWQRNAVINFALCCNAIWRHREKPQYRCTTTIHPVYNCSKKFQENLLPMWLLMRTNLFIPSSFWTTDSKFDTCCQHYVATCGKTLYRCTSTVLQVMLMISIFSWCFLW